MIFINNYYCGVLNSRLILYWDKYPKCSIILADFQKIK